jgi:hypothetical protein
LQIDTSENFNTAEINVTDGFNSEYTVNNLINGKKYYWRVRPYHEFDTGGWYEVYSFTVKSLPALQQPLLYKPNNYKTDVVYKNGIKFDWEYNSEQGIKYNLQVAKTSDFSNPLADLNLTYYSTTLTGFENLTKYYWRVRYIRSNGQKGPWSQIFNFTTEDQTIGVVDDLESKLEVYPNPVKDYLIVDSEISGFYTISDLNGKVIEENTIQTGINEIYVESLPVGTYIFKLTTDRGVLIKKFVKN